MLASALAAFAAPCTPNLDHRNISRTAIQNIQKDKVNSGKEVWRLESKEVAARDEAYKGTPAKAPVQLVKGDDRVQVFRCKNAAGASYEITLKRFDWLLPYSGIYKTMMWTITDLKLTCGK